MHHVLRVSEVPLQEPDQDRVHARGYRRAPLVDHGCGAVHTGLGLCQLEAGGTLDRHLHSYEESFFVLEGDVILELDGRAYRLETGDYGVVQVGVPHGWRNTADGPARWLEMLSPQPRSHPRDTFFLGGEVPHTAERPDLADPSVRFLGHFEDPQLPPPHYLQMDGYSGGNVEGISLKMMVDRVLGAQHLTMAMGEFQPGAAGNVHDHPFAAGGRPPSSAAVDTGIGPAAWSGRGWAEPTASSTPGKPRCAGSRHRPPSRRASRPSASPPTGSTWSASWATRARRRYDDEGTVHRRRGSAELGLGRRGVAKPADGGRRRRGGRRPRGRPHHLPRRLSRPLQRAAGQRRPAEPAAHHHPARAGQTTPGLHRGQRPGGQPGDP